MDVSITNIKDMKGLRSYISEHHIRVVRKPADEMVGFAGLHYDLNDEFGLRIPKDTIWIDQNLRGSVLFKTLKHELVERSLMRKGRKYFSAHKIATKSEAG